MLLWSSPVTWVGTANAPATFAVDVKAVGTPKAFDYLTDVTA